MMSLTLDEPGKSDQAAAAEAWVGAPVSLHFVLAPDHIAAFAAHVAEVSGAAPVESEFRVVCLDTRDDAFARLGLCHGLKSIGGPARQSGWHKFVVPLSAATPKPSRRLLKQTLDSGRIIAVARVETERRRWPLRFPTCRAEVSLDSSTVLMGGTQMLLASVTFSSKVPTADFFRFVADICDPARLRLSAETDLLRVTRLRGSRAPQYAPAFDAKLSAAMTAAEGFRAIAAACFEQFLLNEAAIRGSREREAVHQCRVALRRFSACRRFFSAFLTGGDDDAIRRDFKELRGRLRKARDLQVLLGDVIAPAVTVDSPKGGKALIREIEMKRDAAETELSESLRRPETAALFLRFALWLHAGEWLRAEDEERTHERMRPVVKYAERKLDAENRKFLENCHELTEMSDEDRHRMRIRAKNLRYAAEFLRPLARRDAARTRYRAFHAPLKELQTVLGDWNDILMARRFFSTFAAEAEDQAATIEGEKPVRRAGRPALTAGNALAKRITALPDSDFRERCVKACQALRDAKPFWSKLG
jgi:triphosphatase